ncbi:hypothetical protein D3C75_397250 [compost metagenome]
MIRVEHRNRVGDADIERIIEVGDISQLTAQERAVVIGLPIRVERVSGPTEDRCCEYREDTPSEPEIKTGAVAVEERVNDMQYDQVGAIMFYDKDNVLVGSVGVEAGTYTEEQIESIAESALIEVFSTEEVARIAYFKVETHHLVPPNGENAEPAGRVGSTEGVALREAIPTSYTQNLIEHGLFEKDFYIKHKLEALRILHGGDSFRMQQSLIVKSLMSDLGIDNEECGVNTSDFGLK